MSDLLADNVPGTSRHTQRASCVSFGNWQASLQAFTEDGTARFSQGLVAPDGRAQRSPHSVYFGCHQTARLWLNCLKRSWTMHLMRIERCLWHSPSSKELRVGRLGGEEVTGTLPTSRLRGVLSLDLSNCALNKLRGMHLKHKSCQASGSHGIGEKGWDFWAGNGPSSPTAALCCPGLL